MSENMTKPISFRVTDEQHEIIAQAANDAGCPSVSEFCRRKALGDPADKMRETILFIRELGLSAVAHNNILCDAMVLDDEKRQSILDPQKRADLINQYKMDILEAWEKRIS